jgi:hypothetical protein
MNNHIIRRFELELQVPDKARGIAIQDEILNSYKDKIIQSVASVLDKFAAPDEFLTINRLVIDAGHISNNSFNDVFIERLKETLHTQLEKLVIEARQNAGEEMILFDTDANGSSIEIAVRLKNQARSTQEILWHWLQFGTLPWHSSQHKRIEELVTSPEGKSVIPQLLTELARQRHYSGFQRMALQLKPQSLFSLFAREDVRKIIALLHTYISSRSGWKNAAELISTLLYVNAQWPAASVQEILVMLRQEISQSPAPLYASVIQQLFADAAQYPTAPEQIRTHAQSGQPLPPADWAELAQALQQAQAAGQTTTTADTVKAGMLQQLKQEHVAQTSPDEDFILIQNAGLVLLFPFISTFLTRTGHLENKKFVSETAQTEAAVLLQLLVWGKGDANDENDPFEESQLLLNKILTGLLPGEPLPALHQFDTAQLQTYLEEADKAVEQAIKSWELLKRTTVPAFRKMFLQHQGRLTSGSDGWELHIERDSFDVLIDKLPWPISIIRYPWSEKVVYVTW